MINKLTGSPITSENVYFANDEQASIGVLFYTCPTSLKLYTNWSAQAVNSVLCEIQRNQSNLLTFKN